MYLLTMRQANGNTIRAASSNYSLLVQECDKTPNVVWTEITEIGNAARVPELSAT